MQLSKRSFLLTDFDVGEFGYTNRLLYGKWNFVFNDSIDLNYELGSEYLLIVDGLISCNGQTIDFSDLVNDILKCKYLSDKYDGQFNILLLYGDNLFVITDLININKIYYSTVSGFNIITNNINEFLDISNKINYDFQLDYAGFAQLLAGNYCLYSSRTPIKEVKSFYNACLYRFDNDKSCYEIIDRDRVRLAKRRPNLIEIKSKLSENTAIFKLYFKKYILTISGGVDSRITLMSFGEESLKNNFHAITHGDDDDIEVKIAKRITKYFGIHHSVVSIQKLYPKSAKLFSFFKTGLNLLLIKWWPVIEYLDINANKGTSSVVLLGDYLDLIRAKNVKSIRKRWSRVLVQLGIRSLSNKNYSVERAAEAIRCNFLASVRQTLKNYDTLFNEDIPDEILKSCLVDFEKTYHHVIEVFRPLDGYQLEETMNLLLWGRGSMGNQSRVINQIIPSYSILSNRKIVKYFLGISITDRFEDKLAHILLKDTIFSRFPTSQVPFVNYNFPIFIKYFLWAFRSSADQGYMKMARVFGVKKNRLFQTVNWQIIYSDKANVINYNAYFEKCHSYFEYPISYYSRRANGEARPLSEVDLTAPIVPAYIFMKIKKIIN